MSDLIALHGFLGLPSDWKGFPFPNLKTVDLNLLDWSSLSAIATQVNQSVKEPSYLMGYSLGGRVALHCLLLEPTKWKGAIIISANPGLEQGHQDWLNADKVWEKRFLDEPWDALMEAWEKRPVFSIGGFRFERVENDYDRRQLSKMLVNGSLAKQAHLREAIGQLEVPLLFIVGARDRTYVAANSKLTGSLLELKIIENAGHRVPWEEKGQFIAIVNEWLKKNR